MWIEFLFYAIWESHVLITHFLFPQNLLFKIILFPQNLKQKSHCAIVWHRAGVSSQCRKTRKPMRGDIAVRSVSGS